MKISAMHWAAVEAYLSTDDRAVLPLGSTEQHAWLSLSVDSILAERVAAEAAEPLGVPVFPVLPYGLTPSFLAFAGTISLRVETYARLLRDILDSLARHGFRRIVLVNGHGGNQPAHGIAGEWLADHPGCSVKVHHWWNAPAVAATVHAIDSIASHASWMENFPWTRLADLVQPQERKPMIDLVQLRTLPPAAAKALLGDGNFGGLYERSDAEMQRIWDVGVAETRALIEGPWG